MFARILTQLERGLWKALVVYTSVTDSFSYTVWHHVNCADAVKPNPPIWCSWQVKPDSHNYLHIAVVMWEHLSSNISYFALFTLFLYQKTTRTTKAPSFYHIIIIIWGKLFENLWCNLHFKFIIITEHSSLFGGNIDSPYLSAVSEKKNIFLGRKKVELMQESVDKTVFDTKHKMPLGFLCWNLGEI